MRSAKAIGLNMPTSLHPSCRVNFALFAVSREVRARARTRALRALDLPRPKRRRVLHLIEVP